MKNINKLAIFATAALFAASCSQNEDLQVGNDNFPADGVIRISAGVNNPQTRAGVKTSNLSDFYLFIENPANEKYTYNAHIVKENSIWNTYDAASTGSPLLMLRQNKTQKVNVSAATIKNAPAAEEWKGNSLVTINVLSLQNSEQDIVASDFLYMPKTEVNPATGLTTEGWLNITLNHRLSKINLMLELGTEFNLGTNSTETNPVTAVSVKGSCTQASWNLATNELSNLTNVNGIAPFAGDYFAGDGLTTKARAGYECILIPQTLGSGALSVEVTIGDKTYTWKSTTEITLDSDTVYNLALMVGKDGVTTGSITTNPWVELDPTDIETE